MTIHHEGYRTIGFTALVFGIINILGEIQKVKIENSKISVSEFASGVYFISAIRKNGEQRLSQKFAKK